MTKRIIVLVALVLLLAAIPGMAFAQTYLFSLDKEVVNVYWNEDGSLSIDYRMTFTNDPSASPIDYVDIGMPDGSYSLSAMQAEVDGKPISDIQYSPYVAGVALGLGSEAILPGQSGEVRFAAGEIFPKIYEDSKDTGYASLKFSPNWFGSEYVQGNTDLTVTLHLPPGIQAEEPRYHIPENWNGAADPITGLDEEGRVVYTWNDPQANGYTQYVFGASIPKTYVPAGRIITPTFWEKTGIDPDAVIGFGICGGIVLFIILIVVASLRADKKRKLKYLPPKVSIEGHGIKRGLTAVEAAILMEQPMDKILTMILFSVIRKNAASVKTRDPLELNVAKPISEELQAYERDFLVAFIGEAKARKVALQNMIVNLVKNVSDKMRGFSRKETIAYYDEIMTKAWRQVESAGTPEVKGQLFDENLEWTMLDKDFDDHTRKAFSGGPIFVPTWWGHYDPGFSGGHVGGSIVRPSAPGSISSPAGGRPASTFSLPGADFAASVVKGVQSFSSGVVGNLTDFTSGITNRTNPVPVSTSSRSGGGGWKSGGGGGGHSCACACACACAGCACACAGGGR
jgi:hypothetical protein